MKIIECIPNISLGQDPGLVRQIIGHITQHCAAKVLHSDIGFDANRTVLTLAGTPEAIFKAAILCMEKSFKCMDMRLQKGAHPRLGALDVCPFVPVQEVTLEETALLAAAVAQEAAQRFHIPVYLYEENASSPQRKNLAFIRQGEYENLAHKLQTLPPDFGPAEMTPWARKLGACVIGARNPLIAFNINLNTKDVQAARQIAAKLREKNGGLPAVKALGWYMEKYGRAQVSFNLTHYRRTGLHAVFEACKKEAQKRGVQTTGSELIGLAPLEAFLQTGRFYTQSPNAPDEALIKSAVLGLGLAELAPFSAREKILEYRLKDCGLLSVLS